MHYVLIGHSFASTFAAETIRRIDSTGTITVIGDEPWRLYSRAMLHEWLARMVKDELCWLRRSDWAETFKIDLKTGVRAVKLDAKKKTVTCDNGETISYDKVLVACGGKPFIPPGIEGLDAFKQVYSFTQMGDAVEIQKIAESGGSVAVLGSGLIGLQCAEGLRHLGCKVHVVELADMVLPLAVDRTAATMLAATLEEEGITLHLSNSITAIHGTGDTVESVTLKSGEKLPCKAVVIAVGVRPNVEWLKDSGIKIDRGILVDEYLRTNLPDVYAAGDCAQGFEKITGKQMVLATIPVANKQGLFAGYNMAGVEKVYEAEIPLNALQFGRIQVVSYGFVQETAEHEVLMMLDEPNRIYRKVVLKDDRMTGALLLRAIDNAGLYRQIINKGVDVSEIKERLTAIDFNVGDLPGDVRDELFAKSPAVSVATNG